MVSITTPAESDYEYEYMTNAAEEVLHRLDLSYRVVLLCSGDMGFSFKKTYDWKYGCQVKKTIFSSCSNCGDFLARRMKECIKSLAQLKQHLYKP